MAKRQAKHRKLKKWSMKGKKRKNVLLQSLTERLGDYPVVHIAPGAKMSTADMRALGYKFNIYTGVRL